MDVGEEASRLYSQLLDRLKYKDQHLKFLYIITLPTKWLIQSEKQHEIGLNVVSNVMSVCLNLDVKKKCVWNTEFI